MDRPAWQKLWAGVLSGKVTKIVCWRLDRLGRTSRELVTLRDELVARKVGFVALRDGMDLNTPAGRLMFNVIASVAEYETEVRKERQLAGIAKAKADGKAWGGRKPGTRITVTVEKEELVRQLKGEGKPIAVIAPTGGPDSQDDLCGTGPAGVRGRTMEHQGGETVRAGATGRTVRRPAGVPTPRLAQGRLANVGIALRERPGDDTALAPVTTPPPRRVEKTEGG